MRLYQTGAESWRMSTRNAAQSSALQECKKIASPSSSALALHLGLITRGSAKNPKISAVSEPERSDEFIKVEPATTIPGVVVVPVKYAGLLSRSESVWTRPPETAPQVSPPSSPCGKLKSTLRARIISGAWISHSTKDSLDEGRERKKNQTNRLRH